MAEKSFFNRLGQIAKVFPALWSATRKVTSGGPFGWPQGGGYTVLFDGQKNLGELGPAKVYGLNYEVLRTYGWQHFLESELVHLIINRYCTWVIGQGLSLQASPIARVLTGAGIELDTEEFNEEVESLFEAWSESKCSDYSGMRNLNALALEAKKNAMVGGDVFVILRIDKKTFLPTVQLIDGAHVASPAFGTDYFEQVLENGNVIKNGIESNATGEHVAYWVRKKDWQFERVAAKDKATGLTMAYFVNGLNFRLDNNRSAPLLTAILETIKKLERYKEATVGQAEEQSKNVYQIIQEVISDGTNPMLKQAAKAMNPDANDDLPTDREGRQLANDVAASTNKKAWFMPRGQKMENVNAGTGQLYFKDFYQPNADIVCAVIGMPPNVAFSKYNDSFSASRAATKDWEHTMKVDRKKFSDEFLKPIYELFLHVQILKNQVSAPGYLTAFYKNDLLVIEAYSRARFTGPMFPHIDPLKEVKAIREQLGPLGRNIPLTTIEKAVQDLGTGLDSSSITEQFAREFEEGAEAGLDLNYNATGAQPPAEDPEEVDEGGKKKKPEED